MESYAKNVPHLNSFAIFTRSNSFADKEKLKNFILFFLLIIYSNNSYTVIDQKIIFDNMQREMPIFAKRIGVGAPIYLAAAMEYLSREICQTFNDYHIVVKEAYLKNQNSYILTIYINNSNFKIKLLNKTNTISFFDDSENIYITADDKLILMKPKTIIKSGLNNQRMICKIRF